MISSTINNEKICHHLKDWNTKQIRVCRKNVELMNSVKEGAAMAIRECQHQFRYRKWNCTTMNKKNEPVFGNALNKGREERVKDRCLRSLHKVAYLHVAFYIQGVFIWRRASPLCRDPASQLNSVSKLYFRLYERRASPPWRDLATDYPRSRLGGLEILHI